METAEFVELYNRQRGRIYALAYARLHDAFLAEDAAQETLLRLWKAAPRLRFSCAAQEVKYVSLAAVSATQDMAERSGYRAVASLEDIAADPTAHGFDFDPTFSKVADREAVTRAFRLMGQIGAKTVAVLSYRGMGVTDSVIAKTLNITANEVRVTAHRGKKRLRRLMETEGLWP